jgi:exodeoxyribonuclease V beta subunit
VLPGGARVGTLVHDLLERTDFAADDLTAELARAAADAGARRILDGHVDALVAGLALTIETPLGPAFSGARLRDLSRADRRDELSFDLPLAGGDDPHPGLVTMEVVAEVFARLPAGDPLAGYHERLGDPALATAVRGFLTGSIDLVARLSGRYVVVDYKTNHLAPPGEPALAWHYRPEALAEAMQHAHYPLQAAFYAVALHRFLRWRLPGYRPEHHLGPIAYLFVKGMTGPDTPLVGAAPHGVFAWAPPAGFVLALSDVLDEGRR